MRYRNICFCIFLEIVVLFFGSSTIIKAQELSITAQLRNHAIFIGEQTAIDLIIRTADLDNTYLILPPDTAIHKAEVLSFQLLDTINVDERVREVMARMVITSFDSMIVEIPPIGVSLGEEKVFTEPMYLQVDLPDVDLEYPDKYYGARKPWNLPLTWWDYLLLLLTSPVFWILLVVIALSLGGVFIFLHYRRRLCQKQQELLSRPEPPLSIFERQIKELTSSDILTLGEYETFYNLLISFFRTYLEDRLGIAAKELTAEEIKEYLEKEYSDFVREKESALADWIIHSQCIRFALGDSTHAIALSDCDTLVWIVKQIEAREKQPTTP